MRSVGIEKSWIIILRNARKIEIIYLEIVWLCIGIGSIENTIDLTLYRHMWHILAIVDNLNDRKHSLKELILNWRQIELVFITIIVQTVKLECPHFPDQWLPLAWPCACPFYQERQINLTDRCREGGKVTIFRGTLCG